MKPGSIVLAAAWMSLSAAGAFAGEADGGNVEAGEEVFRKCRACHAVGPDAVNKVGPVLNGIIGRKPGTIEGFAYSDANKGAAEKGLVWSEDELYKYIADPRAYMPGNKMAFAGVKDEQDRKDLIAYLKTFSK